MKAKYGKRNSGGKAGSELNYTSHEKGLGGPVEEDPKSGLQPGKGVDGSKGLKSPDGKIKKSFKTPKVK